MIRSTKLAALVVTASLGFAQSAADKAQPATEGLDALYQKLKTAEDQKDDDAIKNAAVETIRAAREVIKAPEKEPGAQTDAEAIKTRVEFAKSATTQGEYALCTLALKERDHQKVIDLYDLMAKEAPDSKYLAQLYSPYAAALEGSGKSDKAYVFAEKAVAKAPTNEDLLLILANGAMTRKQFAKAAGYGTKLATTMTSKAKPEGISAADWDRKKSEMIGRGYYIAGMSYASEGNQIQADKNLRPAIQYIKSEAALAGPALFQLGVANYNIARATMDRARMKEAINFSQQAAGISGPYQDQARKNAWAMQQDLARISGAR